MHIVWSSESCNLMVTFENAICKENVATKSTYLKQKNIFKYSAHDIV